MLAPVSSLMLGLPGGRVRAFTDEQRKAKKETEPERERREGKGEERVEKKENGAVVGGKGGGRVDEGEGRKSPDR